MIAGVFDEFFGVPTHPLAVHAPVVLIPIVAIVAIVLIFRRGWAERVSLAMVGVVFILVALLFAAKESGEALLESDFGTLGQASMIDRHQDLAETTFVMSIVWLLLTAAVAVRYRMQRRSETPPLSAASAPASRDQIAAGLQVLAALAAIITTIWLIRTGHAGAESRWPEF